MAKRILYLLLSTLVPIIPDLLRILFGSSDDSDNSKEV